MDAAQLGAVGFLGVALLALIKQQAGINRTLGRIEGKFDLALKLWAGKEGVRLPPDPVPSDPVPVAMDFVKGGAGD